MIKTKIVKGIIEPFPSGDNRTNDGAELTFSGRVRDMEDGEKIKALEYECYREMAEKELRILAKGTVKKFSVHDLYCQHRIGIIPVGESSVIIQIWSEHRQESLNAMEWFITQLKDRVPIWKWAVVLNGAKIPTRKNP
ncbi:MAG: molybdenum cofactor biosynthesis protein MoaE [Candidatus Marinimicrobia bacterium]|nr:molybdenum cofactor biosynthesis protein MoaE [Candidatus Neomarinimicrobiota bacterium]